ncbi:unnamed protein product, partial [Effrenium voratum]
ETHVYRMSIPMGSTCYAEAEVVRFMDAVMRKQWQGGEYDMFERNCCSFSEALCQHLVGRELPGWVTRFPRLASTATRSVNHLVALAESLAADQLDEKLDCVTGKRSNDFLLDAEDMSCRDQFTEEEVAFDDDLQPKGQTPICRVHSVISRGTMVSEDPSEYPLASGCALTMLRTRCTHLVSAVAVA